jgi:quinoprotein glucose dehydrogenase
MGLVALQCFAQADWPTFGHDHGGLRYSPLKQIDPANVAKLKVAWVYHMRSSGISEAATSTRRAGAHPQTSETVGGREFTAEQIASLPPGKGRETTLRACTTCHSTDMFAYQRHSPAEWSTIVDEMVSNGLNAPAATLDEITRYLAASFPRPLTAKEAAGANEAMQKRTTGHLLSSEMTPIVAGGLMYISTPYHEIVALNPATGKQVWSYVTPGNSMPNQRGVEYWPGNKTHPAEVLCGTRDGLLIALIAKTGKPVPGFGTNGVVNLKTPEVMQGQAGMLGMSSPPITYKNLVITGSLVPESPPKGPSGDVRAWNVVTGKLVWTFHSIPQPGEKGHDTWQGDSWKHRTGVNAWGFLTVDEARGIVYMPFGAPAWDRYGGDRKGDNLFSTTLVAADANTGKELWHFQVVHHDIWDYDLESAPVLLEIKHGTTSIPAVAVVSKSGMVFFFNRVTGKPIYPIEERPVPQSDVPGEASSPTQPFPVVTPPIARQNFTMADIATTTPELEAFCRDLIQKNHMTFGPVYTPLPYKRTIISFPGTNGGPNWGGASVNTVLGILFVNSNDFGRLQYLVTASGSGGLTVHMGPISGRFWDPQTKLLCQQPPWGRLTAIDVNTGKIAWQVPLGVTDSLPKGKRHTGRPNLGGSIATAGGLVFIGATDDRRFRAFDARTGAELWSYKLKASAHAVPATYQAANGKQYVVITAVGGSNLDDPIADDSVIAFALPDSGAAKPATGKSGK